MGISFGKRVYDALNKQITEEFAFGYLCVAMSCVFSDMGLEGCASWVMARSKEKYRNAMDIYRHLQQRSAKVKLLAIPAPKQEWRAPLHIFEEMLRTTQKSTLAVTAMYEASIAEKDYQSQSFLFDLIDRQVVDESLVTGVLDRLRKMQSSDLGVLMFDAELAKKV